MAQYNMHNQIHSGQYLVMCEVMDFRCSFRHLRGHYVYHLMIQAAKMKALLRRSQASLTEGWKLRIGLDCPSDRRRFSVVAKWRADFVGHASHGSGRPWVAEHPKQTPSHPRFPKQRIDCLASTLFLPMIQIAQESSNLGAAHIQVPGDLIIQEKSSPS
jgi:hypothetical protein